MRAAVLGNFRRFNEAFEGLVLHFYLDVEGLVTIGVGNLVTEGEVAVIPMRWKATGGKATIAEIRAEWQAVKSRQDMIGSRASAFGPLTKLEMSDKDIGQLVRRRLFQNEVDIKKLPAFYQWESWPAEAQMAVLSMAWALGPNGLATKFPQFMMAAARADFMGMAAECDISTENNPGVEPRNQANRRLLRNASLVVKRELDLEVLRYPEEIR